MNNCGNCKFWNKKQEGHIHSECLAIDYESIDYKINEDDNNQHEFKKVDKPAFIVDTHGYYYTPLITKKDFYCNLFKEK